MTLIFAFVTIDFWNGLVGSVVEEGYGYAGAPEARVSRCAWYSWDTFYIVEGAI